MKSFSLLALATFLAALPAAVQAATLDGIDVTPAQIRIHTSHAVKHSAFITSGPDRLVVELADTKTAFNSKTLQGLGVWMKSVRSGQFKTSPAVTRVVVDLSGKAPFRVSNEGTDLVVRLGDHTIAAAAPVVPAAPAPVQAPQAAAPVEPPAPAEPAPAAEARVPAPPQGHAPKGVPVTSILYFASAAFMLAAVAVRMMTHKAAAPAPRAPSDPFKGLGLAIDDNEGMIEGLQENFNSLSRRVAILEKKMDEIISRPPVPGAAPNDSKLADEVLELRTVLKSIIKALQLPSKLL